jgi:hypothetical protein
MASRTPLLLGILLPAIFATAVTAFMQQIPTEFTGSQHDSLPVAMAIAKPGLFSSDAFVDAVRHQPTFFWHLVGWLVPLDQPAGLHIMTTGVLVCNFAFFLAIGFLARSLGGGPAACAGSILLLAGMGDPLVGANYVIGNHVTASSVVAGPLVLAVALAVRGRMVAAFALIGICANFHILQSAYVGGLMMAACIARSTCEDKHERTQLILPMMTLVLCALPVLFLIARYSSPGVPDDWASIVRRGHVIHYYLFSQLPLQLLRTLALLVLAVALFHVLAGRMRSHARFLLGMTAAWVVIFLVAGGLLADIAGLPLSTKLQPLRATAWMVILVTPFAVVCLEHLLREEPRSTAAFALAGALTAMLVLTVLRPFSGALNLQLGPLVLLFSVLLLATFYWRRPLDRYASIVAALAVVGPASILIILLSTLPGLAALGTVAGFQLLLLALFIMSLVWSSRSFLPAMRMRHVVGIATLTILVIVLLVAMNRLESNEPLLHHPRDDAWHEAAAFLARNTPPDAIIQGDPRRTGLRTISRRTVFFEQSDDHALYVDPSSLRWLRERAELLRIPLVKTYGKPAPWPALAVPWAELAREHGVTHAMVPAEVMLRDEVIFDNQQWRIYRLNGSTPRVPE